MSKDKSPQGKVIYLPSIWDPKKVREGILEILRVVEEQGQQKPDGADSH